MADDLSGILEKIGGMGAAAKADNTPREPGPGDVQASVATKGNNPLVSLEMSEAELNEWFQRRDRATARVKEREQLWDILLDEYQPIVSKSGAAETVKVQAHFRNVHTKMPLLFYRTPDVLLSPDDPSPSQDTIPNPMFSQLTAATQPNILPFLKREDIIAVKQAVIKKRMGRDGIKGTRLMHELLFDVLAWSGISACKIGYQCVMKAIPKPRMVPAPVPPPMPGVVLGLQSPQQPPPMIPAVDPVTNQPIMDMEEVPVFEDYYARRFSPKKLLFNDDLRSTRYDEDATWLGMDFYHTPATIAKVYGINVEHLGGGTEDDRVHQYKEDAMGTKGSPKLIRCTEIFCKASYFTDEVHPQAMNQLVLIEGYKIAPGVWRPSPDQTFGPDGKLTADSLVGFPYEVLTIRDLADSAFPMADSAFTNSGIKQMSTWRRQSIRLRDAAIGKYLYDSGAFDQEELDQLKNGDIGEFIPVQDGKLAARGSEGVFAQTAKLTSSPDDQRGFAGIKQDMNETLGISSVGAGTENDTVRTATEVHDVTQGMLGRADIELNRTIDTYLSIVRKLDTLQSRYMDQLSYIEVTGNEGAARIQAWNGKMVAGKWLYDIAPDSQLRVDTAVEFKLDMALYNVAAPDPLFNRAYMLKRMCRYRGYDPSKLVMDPAQMMMQPPHGGTASQGAAVSQHEKGKSGAPQNAPGSENHRAEEIK